MIETLFFFYETVYYYLFIYFYYFRMNLRSSSSSSGGYSTPVSGNVKKKRARRGSSSSSIGRRKKGRASSSKRSSQDGNENLCSVVSRESFILSAMQNARTTKGKIICAIESKDIVSTVGYFLLPFIRERSHRQPYNEEVYSAHVTLAIDKAKTVLGKTTQRIRKVWEFYCDETKEDLFLDETGAMREVRKLNAGKYNFKAVPVSMYPVLEDFILEQIDSAKGYGNVKGLWEATKEAWPHLRRFAVGDDPDVPTELLITQEGFRRLMISKLNFHWSSVQKSLRKQSVQRKRRIRRYLLRLANALKKEKEETHVLVFMDESYVHLNHMQSHFWAHKDDGVDKVSKGPRLILVHAMTRDGLLFSSKKGTCMFWSYENDDLTKDLDSAEMVFLSGMAADWDKRRKSKATPCRGDYHDNMCGEMFMKWMEHRFLPAFKKKYPDKTPILILDNAPYHHGRGASYVDIKTLAKYQQMFFLEKYGVNSFSVEREGASIDFFLVPYTGKGYWPDAIVTDIVDDSVHVKLVGNLETIIVRPEDVKCDGAIGVDVLVQVLYVPKYKVLNFPLGPSKEELRQVTERIIREHEPALLLSELRTFCLQNNVELIFTPPYCPDLQPIELIWALSKRFVGKMWKKGRTAMETAAHLFISWYGGVGKEKEKIKPISLLCDKLVEHSLECANARIKKDDGGLKGTIHNLDTSDVAAAEIEEAAKSQADMMAELCAEGDGLNDTFADCMEVEF